MSASDPQVERAASGAQIDPAILAPLRTALERADGRGRNHILTALFGELARISASGPADGSGDERVRELTRKLQAAGEERAGLEDVLATTKADLAHSRAQFDAEQSRANEQQRVIEEQRHRLEALQKERADLEAELVAKNATLHRLEADNESLMIHAQRAEAAGADTRKQDRLEADKRGVLEDLDKARIALEHLRADKDEQIEALKADLVDARSATAAGAEALLAQLWDRLAQAKPALVEGHIPPNQAAAERLFDAFIELSRYADDADKSMRVFLERYTKHHPSVKVPWDVYAKRDDVMQTVKQTLAVKGGRPVGLLKMRLRVLYNWQQAAMIGADSAIESLASELEQHLRGPLGMDSDVNRKIKDFLRDDGHYLFMEHMRELRSQKLAETFGRAG